MTYNPYVGIRPLWGIWDKVKNEWLVDCFDDAHMFPSLPAAGEYLALFKDTSNFEIRKIKE